MKPTAQESVTYPVQQEAVVAESMPKVLQSASYHPQAMAPQACCFHHHPPTALSW